jgi:hypothetical protein
VRKKQREEKMKAGFHIWKALRRHVEKNHTLRVHLVGDRSNDFQLDCVFCGLPVIAGSPALVNHVCEVLVERGVKVVRPLNQPQVRIQ